MLISILNLMVIVFRNFVVSTSVFSNMKDEDGKIIKLGETELTDKQLKMALEQRTVKIAKFVEKEDE